MAGTRPIVDPPSFTSLPFGLWDSIQHPANPPHWQLGVTWIERCPSGAGTTYDECISPTVTGAPPEPPSKSDNVDQNFRGATPITIYTEFDCSPVGVGDAESAARDALSRSEATQLESAVWTGVAGGQAVVWPHLAANAEVLDANGITIQTSATAVSGVSLDIAHGLGLLEADLSECYGGEGVIHISPLVLPTLVAWNLVSVQGDVLRTLRGNRVIVGSGYGVSGPDGTAPPDGSAWIYATGQVFGYRGDVFFTGARESFNRAENTVQMIAERTYVIGWECCHLAALISLGVPIDGV